MAFLLLGLVLLALKFTEYGPVATWSWWLVLAPFGLAVAWWSYSDHTGLTQRRAMARLEKRQSARRQRALEALGLGTRPSATRGASRASPVRAEPWGAPSRPGDAAPPLEGASMLDERAAVRPTPGDRDRDR